MAKLPVVEPYNPDWVKTFELIKNQVWPTLQDIAVGIEHIGSTSIPGLSAKPTIDIDVIVDGKEASLQTIKILEKLGYKHRGDLGIKGREAFKRPENSPKHHLYVCLKDSLSLRNHLLLKEALLRSPDLVQTYSGLKVKLAHLYHDDIDQYCQAKTNFLTKILQKSGLSESDIAETKKSNISSENIYFSNLDKSSLTLLRYWLQKDHIKSFWQESDNEKLFEEKFLHTLPQRSVHAYIFKLEHESIGYIQYYDATKVGGGWWESETKGTYGIDLLIGEEKYLGQGIGVRAVKEFIAFIIEKEPEVTNIIIDPDPNNKAAIKSFEKVGFQKERELVTPNGTSLLMRLHLTDM